MDWVAYEQQKLVSHSSASWKSETRVPAWLSFGESFLLECRLPSCIPKWQKEAERALWGPFYKGTNPTDDGLWPSYLPKTSAPNNITLGIRILTYEFWRDTNIWSITHTWLHLILGSVVHKGYVSRAKHHVYYIVCANICRINELIFTTSLWVPGVQPIMRLRIQFSRLPSLPKTSDPNSTQTHETNLISDTNCKFRSFPKSTSSLMTA